jgi:integrase
VKHRQGNLTIREVLVEEKGVKYTTYRIDGYDLSGNRIRFRSQDKKTAQLKLNELQTQILSAEVENPFRTVQTRLSDTQIRDAELAINLIGDRGNLLDAVKAALDGRNGFTVKLQSKLFSDATAEYLAEQKDRVRPRVIQGWYSTLTRFTEFAKDPLLSSITTETVKSFMSSLADKEGVGPAMPKTRNNARSELHTFFNWCIDPKGWLTENPAAKAPVATIDRGLIDILSLAKCRELMDYAATIENGKTVRYFALALFAGVRPGEIERLARDPRSIDLENNVIHVSVAASKTRASRTITIQPNLREWLVRFPNGTTSQFNKFVGVVRKQCGLGDRARDVLRHTFISNHVASFGSFADTATESGNTETIIRKHYYARVSKPDAKAFWEICPQI